MKRPRTSLRTAFLVYLVLVHALLGAIAYSALRATPLRLLLVELGFVLSLVLGYRLVAALVAPLELVRAGTEMIEEGELTTHFRAVGQPDVDRLLGVYNLMVDRLHDERLRVRERNELLDRLVEASPGGVIVCDFDGLIESVNPAAAEILSEPRSSLIGRAPGELDVLRPLVALEPGRSEVVPLRGGRRLRGTRGEFRDRGFPRAFLLLEELTEELRRSEKEAYGQLIRTISHEVNNSIGPVSSLVDSIGVYGHRLATPERDRFEDGLAIAAQRLDHLRSFVEGFADVVRLPAPRREPCDLERMVSEVMVLIAPLLEERAISWHWCTNARPGVLHADKNQLEQVLLNVLKNAVEAIGEDGTIELSVQRGGDHTWLEIRDTGPGLSEDALGGVFRPFYTTKQNGRGLGLTLVNEILGNHGLDFSLENGTSGGAVFRLVLTR